MHLYSARVEHNLLVMFSFQHSVSHLCACYALQLVSWAVTQFRRFVVWSHMCVNRRERPLAWPEIASEKIICHDLDIYFANRFGLFIPPKKPWETLFREISLIRLYATRRSLTTWTLISLGLLLSALSCNCLSGDAVRCKFVELLFHFPLYRRRAFRMI